MSEKLPPMSDGRMEIHIQRHDVHKIGHLTPEGREHARTIAREKVGKYLDKEKDTNFLVIASNQVFDDREPDFGGQRAVETADEIVSAIRDELKARGLPDDHLFGGDTLPIAMSPDLQEAGIFSGDFMKYLKEKYDPENLKGLQYIWNIYYQDVESEIRKKMSAEGPRDLARRMDYVFKVAEMVGASFHKTDDRKSQPLVVWMVGHGGGLDAFLHHYAGVPVDDVGFSPSDGFTIRVNSDGVVVADVKGKEYPLHQDDELSLPKHPVIADETIRVSKWNA
ncbi:histidine phosphatase family protein [Candidatus Campbellbacteria bacterium]|nr:MAG: histidine phosphatase family protein [Candidatus Campbellbacteria bacterium]